MSQTFKLLKQPTVGNTAVTISRERAEFKSQMVMIRYHVDLVIKEGDRERAEYIYSQLTEQRKKLAGNFGFTLP